jgi:aquaporin Z
MPSSIQKYLVEFIGTFFFLAVILFTGHPLAIGGALAVAIYLGGKISGGNFNPAVTIMMAVGNKMPMQNALPYIIAQIAGGLVALQMYRTFR